MLWDLDRPIEEECTMQFFDFESPEGKRVFWHSSAHVLGEAAERHYGCHLCIGPPTEDGFFYEMGMGHSGDRMVRQEDFGALESIVKSAIKDKQKFERVVVTKENLLEMFKYNKYKLHIISSKIPEGTSTTVYRCGPMVDLCVGPHIPHTGRIKALSILKVRVSPAFGMAPIFTFSICDSFRTLLPTFWVIKTMIHSRDCMESLFQIPSR